MVAKVGCVQENGRESQGPINIGNVLFLHLDVLPHEMEEDVVVDAGIRCVCQDPLVSPERGISAFQSRVVASGSC